MKYNCGKESLIVLRKRVETEKNIKEEISEEKV